MPSKSTVMKPLPSILLIDDDSAVRAGVCRILTAEAMHVVAARGVKDALEYISRHIPDLVITDLHMAPLAGWDLIAYLKSHHPKLPVFVVTALPPPAGGEGMDEIVAYFQKPLDLDALVAAVQRLFGASVPLRGGSIT